MALYGSVVFMWVPPTSISDFVRPFVRPVEPNLDRCLPPPPKKMPTIYTQMSVSGNFFKVGNGIEGPVGAFSS